MSQEGLEKLRAAATAPPAVAKKPAGPFFTFTFPPEVRMFAEDPQTVTLTILDIEQEIHGNKAMEASGNVFKKIAMAVVKFDGRPVDWASGEIDSRIHTMSPKVREQLHLAFLKVHRSSNDEDKAFLDSMQTEA